MRNGTLLERMASSSSNRIFPARNLAVGNKICGLRLENFQDKVKAGAAEDKNPSRARRVNKLHLPLAHAFV